MSFRLSEEEWQLLFDEPPEMFKLYASIRRVMDYRTGIAGQRRKLSEPMLGEVLAVGQLQGRNNRNKYPSRQKIRSALNRLENLGLLERVGTFVFRLPMADLQTTAQKVNNQRTTIDKYYQSDAYRMKGREEQPTSGQVYIHTSYKGDHYRGRRREAPAERTANAGERYLAAKYGKIIEGNFQRE